MAESVPAFSKRMLRALGATINNTNTQKVTMMTSAAHVPGIPAALMDDDARFKPVEESEALAAAVPVKPKRIVRKRKAKIVRTHHENKIAKVPHESLYRQYINREIFGQTDTAIFDFALENNHNILLKGPTGCGKTIATQAWAAGRDKPFYSISSSASAEPQQLFGKWVPSPDGKGLVWLNGPVTDIFINGGCLLINEVNFLPRAIASVMFSALDSRRVLQLTDHENEIIEAHRQDCWCDLDPDDCRSRQVLIVADMNPGYQGTWELNAAFQNRFAVQIEWGYDRAVEERLVLSPSLIECAWEIRRDTSTQNMRTPFSTNMMIEFENTLVGLGWNFALGALFAKFDPRDRTYVRTIWDKNSGNIINDYITEGLVEEGSI